MTFLRDWSHGRWNYERVLMWFCEIELKTREKDAFVVVLMELKVGFMNQCNNEGWCFSLLWNWREWEKKGRWRNWVRGSLTMKKNDGLCLWNLPIAIFKWKKEEKPRCREKGLEFFRGRLLISFRGNTLESWELRLETMNDSISTKWTGGDSWRQVKWILIKSILLFFISLLINFFSQKTNIKRDKYKSSQNS